MRRTYWRRHEIIRLLHIREDRVWSALPVTVLFDSDCLTIVRISAGSRWLAAVDGSGARVHLDTSNWNLAELTWSGDDCTYVIRPEKWCAIGWFASSSDVRSGRYYINGQRPASYRDRELLTLDLELDAEVTPDGFGRRWKDVELFRRARAAGSISAFEEDSVYEDMEKALQTCIRGGDAAFARLFAQEKVVPAQWEQGCLGSWDADGTRR